jgi:hypothetical protein
LKLESVTSEPSSSKSSWIASRLEKLPSDDSVSSAFSAAEQPRRVTRRRREDRWERDIAAECTAG